MLAAVSVNRAPTRLPAMPLCSRCGVIAPAQLGACPVCGDPFTSSRGHVRPTPAFTWVAVRCSFQCRSCQFLSPLDELDIDGSVECAHCGQSQRFDVNAWHEALAFAHAVGDLAYPLPEGRLSHPQVWIGDDNPFLAIGSTSVFAEHRQTSVQVTDGMTIHRSLFIEATPGHPICKPCRAPLELTIDRTSVQASCSGCGSQATYRLPNGATRYCGALAGVVGEAQRSDQRRARMETHAGGPVALKCGECGGALPTTRERVLQCAYCGTASLIPAQARTRDVGQVLTPDIWWVAFVGASAQRQALEEPPMPTPEEKLAAMTKAKLTDLELAAERPGRYAPQLLLNLALPGAALIVAIIVYAIGSALLP